MGANKAILLVEDDPDDVELTLLTLKRSSFGEVTVARDGVAALEAVFAEDARFGLILLDLKMPRVGGLEVLEKIKSDPRTRSTPVVVLSSSGEERDISTSYRLGANSYVCKRVNFEEHSDAVRQIASYWLTLNA